MDESDLNRQVEQAESVFLKLLSPEPTTKREALDLLELMTSRTQSSLQPRVARHVAANVDFYTANLRQLVVGDGGDTAVRLQFLTGRLFRVAGDEDDAIRCLQGAWRDIEREAGVEAAFVRCGPPPLGSVEWAGVKQRLWDSHSGDPVGRAILAAQILQECADCHMLHEPALWQEAELGRILSAAIHLLLPSELADGVAEDGARLIDVPSLQERIVSYTSSEERNTDYFSCLGECYLSYATFLVKTIMYAEEGTPISSQDMMSEAKKTLANAGKVFIESGLRDRSRGKHVGGLMLLLEAEERKQGLSKEQVLDIVHSADIWVSGMLFLLDRHIRRYAPGDEDARRELWRRALLSSLGEGLRPGEVVAAIVRERDASELLLILIAVIVDILSRTQHSREQKDLPSELLSMASEKYGQLAAPRQRADDALSEADRCLQHSLEQLAQVLSQASPTGCDSEEVARLMVQLQAIPLPTKIQELVRKIADLADRR